MSAPEPVSLPLIQALLREVQQKTGEYVDRVERLVISSVGAQPEQERQRQGALDVREQH